MHYKIFNHILQMTECQSVLVQPVYQLRHFFLIRRHIFDRHFVTLNAVCGLYYSVNILFFLILNSSSKRKNSTQINECCFYKIFNYLNISVVTISFFTKYLASIVQKSPNRKIGLSLSYIYFELL